jgi:hypothetical protein
MSDPQPQPPAVTHIKPVKPSQPTLTTDSPVPFIDLDERAVLYPAGKGVTRITMTPENGGIAFDATFAFNNSRSSPRILWLSLADAREFGRCLVDSVYQAKPQNAITETMRIAISVHTNGFHMLIGDVGNPVELFIGLSSIWRFAVTVLRAVDRLSPIEAN